MRIKAFEEVTKMENETTYLYKQHVYDRKDFPTNYVELKYVYGGYMHTLRYSRCGKEGVSLEQAQAMLKVLGIELYEVQEINTFKEFSDWLLNSEYNWDGELFTSDGSWFDTKEMEEKCNVKLNILRGE